MAQESSDLMTLFAENRPSGEFRPCVFYGFEEDALYVYFSNAPEYAKRLNSRITVYLALETNELVGCQIKGVRAVLEDLDSFDVEVSQGRVKLSIVFLAYHATIADDPAARNVYQQLARAASQANLEIDVPNFAAA